MRTTGRITTVPIRLSEEQSIVDPDREAAFAGNAITVPMPQSLLAPAPGPVSAALRRDLEPGMVNRALKRAR
jgi:hypothetical protein